MKKYRVPVIIIGLSTILAVGLSVWLLTHRPPQCTTEYTKAQIDAAHCIIGADIGTGFGIAVLVFVWVWIVLAMLIWMLVVFVRGSRGAKDRLRNTPSPDTNQQTMD